MTRPCTHGNTGYNPRACSLRCGGVGGGGPKLFGVRLTDGSFIQKSASMGNLSHYSAADSIEGYHSDDLNHSSTTNRRPVRKKGIPWTEEEHKKFLLGLHKLGRGNWRGISRNYVHSRTPTQVASHAQKYFIRQSNAAGKKKRPSLFDLASDLETNSSMPEQATTIQSPAVSTEDEKKTAVSPSQGADINSTLPSLDLSLKLAFTPFPFQLWPPNAYSLKDDGAQTSQHHTLKLAFTPFPFQLCPPNAYSLKDDGAQTSQHHIIKPVQVNPEETMKELVGLYQLTL